MSLSNPATEHVGATPISWLVCCQLAPEQRTSSTASRLSSELYFLRFMNIPLAQCELTRKCPWKRGRTLCSDASIMGLARQQILNPFLLFIIKKPMAAHPLLQID